MMEQPDLFDEGQEESEGKRYWLTPPDDPDFDGKVAHVCEVYQQAPARHEQGERTVSSDELTGVQALERKQPGLPMAPGKVERREFEYIRHGTATSSGPVARTFATVMT